MKNSKKLSGVSLFLVVLLLDIIIGGIWYYFAFPALNIHNQEFWGILIVLFSADMIMMSLSKLSHVTREKHSLKHVLKSMGKDALVLLAIDAAIIVIVLIGSLAGWKLLRAKSYASLLQVNTRDFTEDIPETSSVTNIALMDTESARVFGNREVGSLSDVVSQYEVEDDYTQINYQSKPQKVAALKYASFFKWLKNRNHGIPGYVQVNPVNSDASYVKLKEGMKYVPSGVFNDNLMRHVQFQYPDKIITGYYFEIDDEGNPYYICPCESAKIGLFNGMDVVGAVICNPITGESKYYKVQNIPHWVDRVYDGELCTRKYDWHGILSGGFWNSIISQTNCTKTTDDYGYIAMEDDIWIYTGVTSLNNDSSNVGFVMINQRTSEARYYVVSGAEEYSAMKSAEGTVQEKHYDASFPCLINVGGQPTYIMVLKDGGGLVKMYAMVNVEQYNIVATGNNQADVFKEYKKEMKKEGIKEESNDATSSDQDGSSEENAKTIQIKEINFLTVDGDSIVYIKDMQGNVYKQPFAENEQLITLSEGDQITVYVNKDDSDIEHRIFVISSFQVIKKQSETTNVSSTTERAIEQ